MKYKVWFIGDGYLLDHVFEAKGDTFAKQFNSILRQVDEYINAETYVERYDIDHIEEVNE